MRTPDAPCRDPHEPEGQQIWPAADAQLLWCDAIDRGAFSPEFILVDTIRWFGPLDLDLLRSALAGLVERHEILRTRLERRGTDWVQVVYPPSPVEVQVSPLQTRPDETIHATVQRLCRQASSIVVDPARLPLLAVAVHPLDIDDFVISLATHHTAADEIGYQVMLNDLGVLYHAAQNGADPDLRPAPQFGPFAVAQRALLESDAGAPRREFWRRRLDGSAFFTVPTDRPIPANQSLPYRAYNFDFTRDQAAAVRALSARHSASANMVLLAGIIALAQELRPATPDPVINTLAAGRFVPEFAATVGPLLNFIPIRIGATQADSLDELVTKTRQACLESYLHELPVGYLERSIPSLTEPLSNPDNCDFSFGFFRVGHEVSPLGEHSEFVLIDEPEALQIPGGMVWNMRQSADGGFQGRILYSPDTFDVETISNWADSFAGHFAAAADGSQW